MRVWFATSARRPALLAVIALGAMSLPSAAQAHGNGSPSATDFLAKLTTAPSVVQARVVDGDVRMWLKVPANRILTVADTSGGQFLRFSPRGVDLNLNSAMYYLSQNPPLAPPRKITASTPPRWSMVSSGHSYRWVDPRLQALDIVSRAPGASYVGTWRIPLVLNGRRTAITGTLSYRGPPSLVWFWPLIVLLACLTAALRLRRRALDLRVARWVAAATLCAIAVGALARGLHGRPGLSASALLLAGVILALVVGGARLLRTGSGETVTFALIAIGGLAEGITMLPTLLHGFVLLALPAPVVRTATVLCLSGGAGLITLLVPVGRALSHDEERTVAV